MPSKKKWLAKSRLYLILDTHVKPYEDLLKIAERAVAGGVDILELRDKEGRAKDILGFSRRLKEIIQGTEVLYIINDRADLALACCASGVHLGQDDLPVKAARRILGPQAIIGVSCQTVIHAKRAQAEGADYLGFGSVFKTLTKPDRQPMDLALLQKALNRTKIPVFPIGGINLTNLPHLRALGLSRVAVCRAILDACDVKKTIGRFLYTLDSIL